MSFGYMIKKVVASVLVLTFGFSNASSFPVSDLPSDVANIHPSLTREGAAATAPGIASFFRQFRKDNSVQPLSIQPSFARSEARNTELKHMGLEDLREIVKSLPKSQFIKSTFDSKTTTERTLHFGNTTVSIGVEYGQYADSGKWQMRLHADEAGVSKSLFDWTYLPRFRIDPRPTSILHKKNGEEVRYDEDYGFVAFGLKTIPSIHQALSSPLLLLVVSDRFYKFLQDNQFDNFSGEATDFVSWKIIPESEATSQLENLQKYIGLEQFYSRSEARKSAVQIRKDAKEGELAESWGNK